MRLAQVVVLVVSMASGLSCVSTAKHDEAHLQRVAEINARYEQLRAESQQQFKELMTILVSLDEFLVPIRSGSRYSPVERTDESEVMRDARAMCARHSADLGSQGVPAEDVEAFAAKCQESITSKLYLPTLTARFYRADPDRVLALARSTKDADIEAMFAYAHNTELMRVPRRLRAEAQAWLDDSLASIERMRVVEVSGSTQQRDYDVARDRARQRQRLAGIAAAMQSLSQPSSVSTAAEPSRTCSSDFTCGSGFVCVKDNYSSAGVCARSVNKYGAPVYDMPRLDSVGPKLPVSTDCAGVLDCPAGFRCDMSSGTCLR